MPTAEGSAPVRATAAACLATTAVALPVFLIGALAVLVADDLGLSEGRLGLLVTAYFATSAVLATPVGRLVERVGARTGVRTGVVLGVVSLLGVGLVARSVPLLAVALALGGAGNALAQLGANLSVARAVPVARQGLAYAVKQIAVPLSTLLAGLAVPLVGLRYGWEWAFTGAAVLVLPVLLLVPRDAPGAGRRPAADRGRARVPRGLYVVAVGAGLGSGAANALGAFLVASAVEVGVSTGTAGLLLAGGSAAGVAGRLGAGVLADRRGRAHLPVVGLQLGVGALGSALVAAASAGAPAGLLIPGALLAFGFGWAWPGLLNFAVVRVHPAAPAAATGVSQTGVFAGGAAGPLAFGIGVEVAGYAAAWLGAAVAQLLACGLVLSGRRLLLTERAAAARAAGPSGTTPVASAPTAPTSRPTGEGETDR